MYGEEGENSDPYVFRKFLAVVGNGVSREKNNPGNDSAY